MNDKLKRMWKKSMPKIVYYPSIWLERLKKTMKRTSIRIASLGIQIWLGEILETARIFIIFTHPFITNLHLNFDILASDNGIIG